MKCKCGSFAINPHMYGRDDTDLHLCDVCYWRKRVNNQQQLKSEIAAVVHDMKVDSKKVCGVELDYYIARLIKLSGINNNV